jgi:molybdopterin-guanine dinucleotide biosynthesis protein A
LFSLVITELNMPKTMVGPKANNVAAVILAGGQSRRFGGGDKFLKDLNGKPLLDRVIERIKPQVDHLIINANNKNISLSSYGLPIVADTIQGYAGPLAGILTGLEWIREHASECKWLGSFPSDAPFVPLDCVRKMHECAVENDAEVVCAVSGGRTHPVCALWRVELAEDLRNAMIEENMRKIDLWTSRYKISELEFSNQPYDPFFNVNRPEDLTQAEKIAADLSD